MISLGHLFTRVFQLVTLAGMPGMSRSEEDCPRPQDYLQIFWSPSSSQSHMGSCWFQNRSGTSYAALVTLATQDSVYEFRRARNYQPQSVGRRELTALFQREISTASVEVRLHAILVCSVKYQPSAQVCTIKSIHEIVPEMLSEIKLASAASPIHGKESMSLDCDMSVRTVPDGSAVQPQCRFVHREDSYTAVTVSLRDNQSMEDQSSSWRCTFTIEKLTPGDLETVGCVGLVDLSKATVGRTATFDLATECSLRKVKGQFTPSKGSILVDCEFSTACPWLPFLLYVYADTGQPNATASKAGTTRLSETTTVTVTTTKTEHGQNLSIHLHLDDPVCIRSFTCGVKYQGSDTKQEYTKPLKALGRGKAQIIRTVPATINPTYTITKEITLHCRGMVSDLPTMTLMWIYTTEGRTCRIEGQRKEETFSHGKTCPVYIYMVLTVNMGWLRDRNNTKFGCAVGKMEGDSPHFTVVNWTEPIQILECPLKVWWTKKESLVGDTARMVCHWNTECEQTRLKFQIFSDKYGVLATEDRVHVTHPKVTFTAVTAPSGEITLTFDNFQSRDEQELACITSFDHTRADQQITEREKLHEKVCRIQLSCNGSSAMVGSPATGLCTWQHNCVSKAWHFTLVGVNGTKFNSDTGPLDHQMETVDHTSLSNDSGKIMYTLSSFSCQANFTLTLKVFYTKRSEKEKNSTTFNISVTASAEPPVICRSTPPLHMLTLGIKEGSIMTLTCATDRGSMWSTELVWHVVKDQEESLLWENVTTRVREHPIVNQRNCPSWERESTLFVNLTRINTHIVFKCYVVENPDNTSELSIADFPSVESVPIIIHYAVSEETTTVMIDKPDYGLGDSVTLTCCATSHPPPSYLWRTLTRSSPGIIFMGQNINSCNQLVLPPLRYRHSGTYRCLVTNQIFAELFEAEKPFQLTLPVTDDDDETTPEITTKVGTADAGSYGWKWPFGGRLGALAATILFVFVTSWLCCRSAEERPRERRKRQGRNE